MSGTPDWLAQMLKAEEAAQLLQEARDARQDLAGYIQAARVIVGQAETQALGVEQEKLAEESAAYLNAIPARSLWYRFRQMGKLEQLATDLTQHADALVKDALPYLDAFVVHIGGECKTIAKALLYFHGKNWNVARGSMAIADIQHILQEIQSLAASKRHKNAVLLAYAAYQQTRQLSQDIQIWEEHDAKNDEARRLLSQLQSDYPARESRLAVQWERLGHFKQVCVSWRDIEPLLEQASELLTALATGLADLATLIEHDEPHAAVSMATELQASLDQIKSLCDRSEEIRTARRNQLKKASDTATHQLQRARRATRGHGNPDHNRGLQSIRAFVGMYRQALKERGSLLTVEAIVEQAQAITLAVDALALSPRAAVDVAVQKEFAELGCFPE